MTSTQRDARSTATAVLRATLDDLDGVDSLTSDQFDDALARYAAVNVAAMAPEDARIVTRGIIAAVALGEPHGLLAQALGDRCDSCGHAGLVHKGFVQCDNHDCPDQGTIIREVR